MMDERAELMAAAGAPATQRPKLLDLYCGAGGASMGYALAGFDVTGVDIKAQPHYPFRFFQADALEFLTRHGYEYAVIAASPPCQGYSRCRHIPGRTATAYPLLINATLTLLRASGRPWVLENVPGAALDCSITLCGQMFGLRVYRHRQFASNILLLAPPHLPHRHVLSAGRLARYFDTDAAMVTVAGHMFSTAAGARAMDIDWMARDELAEAIPPAYTKYVGLRLQEVLHMHAECGTGVA